MTYHEFASEEAINEIGRIIVSGERIVVDWSGDGNGESGPPLDERFAVDEVNAALQEAGFEIQYQATRPETFVIQGRRSLTSYQSCS